MDETLRLVEKAMQDCLETHHPQQIELDTTVGRFVILIARLELDDEVQGEKH